MAESEKKTSGITESKYFKYRSCGKQFDNLGDMQIRMRKTPTVLGYNQLMQLKSAFERRIPEL